MAATTTGAAMDASVEQLSAELAGMLVAATERVWIDPASVPWRSSTLRQCLVSGAHYRLAAQDQEDAPLAQRLGAGPGRDKTAAMTIGSGAHAIIFETPYAVYDLTAQRRGPQWTAFQREHEGAAIMNAREFSIARGIADAVRRHPLAEKLLLDPALVREQRIDFEWLGRKVRATPDARSHHLLVELKTTRCAEPHRFARDAMFRGYHAQVALYADAIIEAGLGVADECYLFAVENAEPFNCSVIRVDDHTIEEGRRKMRLCAELALNWERAGVYPGYIESPVKFCDVVDVAAEDPLQLVVNGEEVAVE